MNRISVDKYYRLLHFTYNILRSSSSIFSRKISPTSGRVSIVCSSIYSPSRGLQFYCALLHVSRTVDGFTESYYVISCVSRTSRHSCSALRLCIYTWEGTKKFPELLKNLIKIFVQVWNFSPLRSTPLATGCSNPSTAPNWNAVKGRQRIAGGPWQHFRWRF